MSTHLIADPAVEPTTPARITPDWDYLSAVMTDQVPSIAARDDLLVSIAPGAGGKAPACFYPSRALIEVDGDHLAVKPATARAYIAADRARYAVAWGLLTHECAHAAHTRWRPTPSAPASAVQAALLLEEPRIEGAQLARRPDDRRWLRASATKVVVDDLAAFDPAKAADMSHWDAAECAALLLGRVDAGVLTVAETEPVRVAVENVLGAATLQTLRTIWRDALRADDHDTDTMIDLGRKWCEALGVDPEASDPADPSSAPGSPGTPGTGHPSSDPSGDPDPAGTSALADAVTAAVEAIADAVAADAADELAANEDLLAAMPDDPRYHDGPHKPFHPGRITATRRQRVRRTPRRAERSAARALGRALTTAGTRERAAVRTTSALPPGRLRMRGALAADAQRAAGAIPTAEPFTRTTRAVPPAPPLRVGIACDVSGSMSAYAKPVASAAWILAHATKYTVMPATSASLTFGAKVLPLTAPGEAPATVTQFRTNDGYEAIDDAVDALDEVLGLRNPGAARLLVIVSDGQYWGSVRDRGIVRVKRLLASGCGVLWLATGNSPQPFDGTTVRPMTKPTTTAREIGRAATAALRAAAR